MRGGARKGAGKKPGPSPQSTSKTIRWNPSEWSEVEQAAERAEETTSEFIRTAALKNTIKTVNKAEFNFGVIFSGTLYPGKTVRLYPGKTGTLYPGFFISTPKESAIFRETVSRKNRVTGENLWSNSGSGSALCLASFA